MNMTEDEQARRDPLGLSRLPAIEPGRDDWSAIAAELAAAGATRRERRRWFGGFAAAATIVLAATLLIVRPGLAPDPGMADLASAVTGTTTSAEDTVAELIALSQRMDDNLHGLSRQLGVIPARTQVYQAELEDLIAQVDGALSNAPGSASLWAQRINLQLDLATLYEAELRREQPVYASL